MKTTLAELRDLIDGPGVPAAGPGADALEPLRPLLVALDTAAYDARGPLNVMVKNAVALAVAAEGIESAATPPLVKAKDVAGRVLTAYAELVALLSSAQASVGYTTPGPSVVTGEAPAEAEG